MTQTPNKLLGRGMWLEFLTFFTPITLCVLIGFYALQWNEHSQYMEVKKTEEHEHVNLIRSSIYRDLESLSYDALVLADSEALLTYLNKNSPENHQKLVDRLVTFSNDRLIFDQIRFLDETGMEVVRVNLLDDDVVAVPVAKLQDKGGRYYFKESIVLRRHQLYFSPLDLNVENGQVETPYKPVIRVATPVFDLNGKKRGVLILNYLAKTLLDRFDTLISAEERKEYSLVNDDGFWLDSADPEDEWGFMLGKTDTVGKRFPEAWQKMGESESGQFSNGNGLFTYSTVAIRSPFITRQNASGKSGPSLITNKKWRIISHQSYDDIKFDILDRRYINEWGIVLALVLTLATISWWLGKERRLRKEVELSLMLSKEEAEKANTAKSEFLAAMSHDLRTPLNAIMGFAEIMQLKTFGSLGDPHYEKYVTDIHDSGSLLVSLINDVLDLSKIEAGKYILAEEVLDVPSLVETSFRQLSKMAEASHQKLSSDIPPDFPKLLGDNRALTQVLNNLISNAIKFTPANGSIEVLASVEADNAICLKITDTGIGMSDTGLIKALKPFEQADSSNPRNKEGTGLGLHLCVNLMKLFGGSLDITSKIAVGTTVTLLFPPEKTLPHS